MPSSAAFINFNRCPGYNCCREEIGPPHALAKLEWLSSSSNFILTWNCWGDISWEHENRHLDQSLPTTVASSEYLKKYIRTGHAFWEYSPWNTITWAFCGSPPFFFFSPFLIWLFLLGMVNGFLLLGCAYYVFEPNLIIAT